MRCVNWQLEMPFSSALVQIPGNEAVVTDDVTDDIERDQRISSGTALGGPTERDGRAFGGDWRRAGIVICDELGYSQPPTMPKMLTRTRQARDVAT